MKRLFTSFRFMFLMFLVFVSTFVISSALAENIAVLTVSDDRLESIKDPNSGITLRNVIEVYVQALEASGDKVYVLGSKSTKNVANPNVIHSAEFETLTGKQAKLGRMPHIIMAPWNNWGKWIPSLIELLSLQELLQIIRKVLLNTQSMIKFR